MTIKFSSIATCAFLICLSVGFDSCYYKVRGEDDIQKHYLTDTIDNIKLQLVSNQIKEPVDLQICSEHKNRLYISDLKGKILILDHGKLLPHPFLDVNSIIAAKEKTPPKNFNENILFGMAFHPDFTKNHKFYVCYKAPNDSQRLNRMVVSEFLTNAGNQNLTDSLSERVVLEIHDKVLNDGTIAFGPDGYLYLNFADMDTLGGKLRAQDLTSLLGKVLRIDINKIPYGIPSTNPYATSTTDRPEIWAAGFRKLWRFSFDPKSQMMLGADVGDKKLEEVDIIKKGGNYGWPIAEGDSIHPGNYKLLAANFVPPINTYPRTVGICTIGGYVYEGNDLPVLRDKYVFGDVNGSIYALSRTLNSKWIRQVIRLKNPPIDPLIIYSFGRDEKGELYVIGRLNGKAGLKGTIFKLVKA